MAEARYQLTPAEWLIERVDLRARPDKPFQRRLQEWAGLRDQSWNVTVLAALDSSHVVALGCR